VDPRIAARAMVLAVVLVAVAVSIASLLQTPTYEASAQVRVDQVQGDQQTYVTGSGEMIKTLPPKGWLQQLTQTMTYVIDSRPVAEETIRRLGLRMEPAELSDNLTVEQVGNTNFIRVSYESNDPGKAQQIANTVGQVATERMSEVGRVTAGVLEKATVPVTPVSPDPLRNGLLTLVLGLVLCAALRLALIHRSS
jgi:capsular polysaccharide biosynthesis protein